MVKKYFLFFILLMVFNANQAQCNNIDSFISDNYTFDAKILASREASTVGHPEIDNPMIVQSMVDENLRLLNAIYNVRNSMPEAAQVFNDFQTHVNIELQGVAVNAITIEANNSMSTTWITDLINTGISGIPALDNLISTYNFSYDSTIGVYNNFFTIRSSHEVLNIAALKDDFQAINEITSAEPFMEDISNRMNYNGIQYYVFHPQYGSGPMFSGYSVVQAMDIEKVNTTTFRFKLFGGDCLSGCLYDYYCDFSVDSNCNVTFNGCVGKAAASLSTNNYEFSNIEVYPNPVKTELKLNNLPESVQKIELFSLLGKRVIVKNTNYSQINVQNLAKGMYFLKVTLENDKKLQLKIIKE